MRVVKTMSLHRSTLALHLRKGFKSALTLTALSLCVASPPRPYHYNWDMVRDTAMEQALHAKFTQHEHLRQLLLSTEPRNIVYHIMSDEYWGDGGDGGGRNQLGKMLMQLRSVL